VSHGFPQYALVVLHAFWPTSLSSIFPDLKPNPTATYVATSRTCSSVPDTGHSLRRPCDVRRPPAGPRIRVRQHQLPRARRRAPGAVSAPRRGPPRRPHGAEGRWETSNPEIRAHHRWIEVLSQNAGWTTHFEKTTPRGACPRVLAPRPSTLRHSSATLWSFVEEGSGRLGFGSDSLV